jgi:hypothetical protein
MPGMPGMPGDDEYYENNQVIGSQGIAKSPPPDLATPHPPALASGASVRWVQVSG